jgi:hypothetical protein
MSESTGLAGEMLSTNQAGLTGTMRQRNGMRHSVAWGGLTAASRGGHRTGTHGDVAHDDTIRASRPRRKRCLDGRVAGRRPLTLILTTVLRQGSSGSVALAETWLGQAGLMSHRLVPAPRSSFAGFRFLPNVRSPGRERRNSSGIGTGQRGS